MAKTTKFLRASLQNLCITETSETYHQTKNRSISHGSTQQMATILKRGLEIISSRIGIRIMGMAEEGVDGKIKAVVGGKTMAVVVISMAMANKTIQIIQTIPIMRQTTNGLVRTLTLINTVNIRHRPQPNLRIIKRVSTSQKRNR